MKYAATSGFFIACLLSASARAEGTPPADVGAAVTAPKAPAPPEPEKASTDFLNAAINLGAQLATGNSRLFAASGGAKLDMRSGNEGFGAAFIANYSTSDTGSGWKDSTRNFQGKLRYERYFSRNLSAFVQLTGTNDAFQAITFRFNVDPGIKYLIVNRPHTKFWGELGYDFEYDLNYTDALGFEQAGTGGNVVDTAVPPLPYVLVKDGTMQSVRAYMGFQHAFNKEVLLTSGLEFLQGLGGSGGGLPEIPAGYTDAEIDRVKVNLTRTRVNFDAVVAAKLGAGFAVAASFAAKWNSAPLPGKENIDTMTTLSLIYSFSRAAPAPPTPPPPAPPPSTASNKAPPPPNTVEANLAAFVEDRSKPVDETSSLVLDRVTFKSASEIDMDASKEQLQNIAAIMNAHLSVKLKIGGYTDNTGSPDDNKTVSLARANAVQAALVGMGIAASRLSTEG